MPSSVTYFRENPLVDKLNKLMENVKCVNLKTTFLISTVT